PAGPSGAASIHAVAAARQARLVGAVVLGELRLEVLVRLHVRLVLWLHGAPGADGAKDPPHRRATSRHLSRLALDASTERAEPRSAGCPLEDPAVARRLGPGGLVRQLRRINARLLDGPVVTFLLIARLLLLALTFRRIHVDVLGRPTAAARAGNE